jgi:hypothetical protein
MKRQWLFIALAGTVAAAQAADAYRWVDAKGGVHYSDAPPPVEFRLNSCLPGTASRRRARQCHAGRTRQGGRFGEPARRAGHACQFGATPKRCEDARANLEVLQRSGPVGMDTGTGKPQPLDDAARQRQIGNAQTIIATYCK